CTTWKGFW
nr:immunoglobulin heavy chain junction region [Mus musculus]MBK4195124.1 immunoglobulin heavy chain junction region [Mus musculus]